MISRLLFIVFLLLSTDTFSQSSFYSIDVLSVSGDIIHFSYLRGKRVLLVNVSSEGARHAQLTQLEALQQQHRDSGLVIVAFPSNDFNTEPKNSAELQSFYSSYHFLVAAKTIVQGNSKSSVYSWLAEQNGNAIVGGDYQKFLISDQGQLIGIYSGRMFPMEKPLIETLQRH
jgi:glutathione peroxidase